MNENRVSVEALERACDNEYFSRYEVVQWNGIEVTVRQAIPLTEMLGFVNDIVDACFLEDGTYFPEAEKFAVKVGVLSRYTNIEMPDDVEKQYWIAYDSGIFDTVYGCIDVPQLNEIIIAAEKRIQHMCNSDIAAIMTKLNALVDAFGMTTEKMAETFSNINDDDLEKLVNAIGDGGFDADKIVAAYANRLKEEPDEEPKESLLKQVDADD